MRSSPFVFLFILLSFSGLQAQDLSDVSFARGIIDSLTSERFAGRGYQENGHLIAAEFIARQFKEIGLAPEAGTDGTYFQHFPVTLYLIDSASISFDGGKTNLIPGVDFVVHGLSGGGIASDGFSPPMWGIPDDFGSRKHTICVIREGLPPQIEKDTAQVKKFQLAGGESAKIDWATKAGYGAIILLKKDLTGGYIHQAGDIPVIEVLESVWPKKYKSLTVAVHGGFRKIQTQNVIGIIPAPSRLETAPVDSCIIISAHYDHLGKLGTARFPGGNDNAVGIAMMLDMAKQLITHPLPRHHVMFVAFGAEEAGLVGSKYYVDHPIYPLALTSFVLNLDLMGNGVDGITAVGANECATPFNRLKNLNDSLKVVPLIKPRKNAPNSDQYFFILKGVPALFLYTMGGPKWYHDVNDTGKDLELREYCPIRDMLTLYLRKF